jgi:hypothetical protein
MISIPFIPNHKALRELAEGKPTRFVLGIALMLALGSIISALVALSR